MSKVEKEEKIDLSFEIALLEGIYRRDKDDARIVEALATLYTEAGLYDKGLALDRHHVALEPRNPTSHYNFACSLCLTGEMTEAFKELELSLRLGFDSLDWMQKDPDLEAARADPRWRKLVSEHGIQPADE